jgi:hypothetical protein
MDGLAFGVSEGNALADAVLFKPPESMNVPREPLSEDLVYF